MAFGVKFIPLKPATHLPSRRDSLVDVTNASAPFSSEEVNRAIQYVDALMNDFLRTSSQSCDDNDCSSLPAQSPMPQINDDKMEVDNGELEPPEDYDVFPDLAFLESMSPQHSDFSLSMGDQFSTEFNEDDITVDQMAELRALLLETFPDGMPNEIDYESILADQRIPSDPLDLSFWNYFELERSAQTENTVDERQTDDTT